MEQLIMSKEMKLYLRKHRSDSQPRHRWPHERQDEKDWWRRPRKKLLTKMLQKPQRESVQRCTSRSEGAMEV
jgi:hypothetical protein